MKYLLYYLLQVIVASGILYGYYHFALRNKKFHRYNRFYLLAATVVSITIPFLNIPVYFTQSETDSSFVLQTLTVISSAGPGNSIVGITKPENHTSWFTWQNLSFLFYILIASFILIRIIFSLLKIRRIVRNNPAEELDKIRFINTTEPGTPFSFFRWLFWNKKIELQSEKGEQIFRHELFHIEQKHSSDIMYLELLTVLCWINPFFHLIKKEIKAIHEFLADQFAITENKKWEYAELLLMQVLNTQQQLVNPFFNNQIKRRIAMITTSNKPSHQYLRKLMVFPVAAVVIGLFAFSYKNKEVKDLDETFEKAGLNMSPSSDTTNPVANQTLLNGNLTVSHNPAIPSKIIINGKEIIISKLTLEGFDTAKIVSAELYFDTTTGFDTAKVVSGELHAAGNKKDTSREPIILIDGVKQVGNSTVEILKPIDPALIQSVNVIKGEPAVAKYGEEARNGAIEIIMKKTSPVEVNEIMPEKKNSDLVDNKIFSKADTDPSFPGGAAKWKQYLERNFNKNIPSQKGAPVGIYTVIVQFIVKKDSFITDVKALTNHGFGMEEEVIRLISKGPRWIPAVQNGKQVTAYWKQPVTFYVASSTSQNTPPDNKNFTPTPYDTSAGGSKALFVIDGKIQEGSNTLNKINPNDIESMKVLKGASATSKYGDKGKNGVIEIITRKSKNLLITTSKNLNDKIFTETETRPSFPGGDTAWRKYLERNANGLIPVDSGAPAGRYTVVVQFIVEKDGTISDVKALTKHGYGMENEVLRLIKNGPKWIPATQNGKTVKAYTKQPVTFEVEEEKKAFTSIKTEKLLPEIVMVSYVSQNPAKYTATSGNIQTSPVTKAGSTEWRRFFERNLDSNIPINDGWNPGSYKILIQFAQNEDGTISEIKALTYQKSKTAENCINTVKHIQRILSEKSNDVGKKIYFVQPFTFQII